MADLVRTLLGPLLLVQGKQLFKTIPKLPEPPGDRTGTRGSGPPLRVLIVGDSSGAGVGAETQDEALLGQTVGPLAKTRTVTFRLDARHGSTLPRTLRHLRQQAPEAFDVAVTAIGINDITAGREIGPWMASYRALVAELRQRFGVAHIVASGLPPIGRFPAIPNPLRWYLGRTAQRYDAALKAWAATQPDVTYIDFATEPGDPLHGVPMKEVMSHDGFHPGPPIYTEWGRRVAAKILARA